MAGKFESWKSLVKELEKEVGPLSPQTKNILRLAIDKKPPYGLKDLDKVRSKYDEIAYPGIKVENRWCRPSEACLVERDGDWFIEAAPGARIIPYQIEDRVEGIVNYLYQLGKEGEPDIEKLLEMETHSGPYGILFKYIHHVGPVVSPQGQTDTREPCAFLDIGGKAWVNLNTYLAPHLNASLNFFGNKSKWDMGWDERDLFPRYSEPVLEKCEEAKRFRETVDLLRDASPVKKLRALESLIPYLHQAVPRPALQQGRVIIKWPMEYPLAGAYIYLAENELEGRSLNICENSSCNAIFYDPDPRKKYCSDKCRTRAGAVRAKEQAIARRGGTPAKRGRPPKTDKKGG